jgi:hypothetical protein
VPIQVLREVPNSGPRKCLIQVLGELPNSGPREVPNSGPRERPIQVLGVLIRWATAACTPATRAMKEPRNGLGPISERGTEYFRCLFLGHPPHAVGTNLFHNKVVIL